MDQEQQQKFWIEDPCILVTDFNIVPMASLSMNERLNALTRLILIITAGMFFYQQKHWLIFLLVGMMVVFFIKISSEARKEGFSIPPTYTDGAEPLTTIPPLHAEEWQSPPPIYDEYTNIPPYEGRCGTYKEERPIFGQYVSSNKLFPYQQQEVRNRSLGDAQLYMNDEFTKYELQHRNDMIRNYVNKMDRLYRHGCYDAISPTNSY